MADPLSDKAIAQALRDHVQRFGLLGLVTPKTIFHNASKLSAASHGEDIHSCSPYCERPECVRERGEDEARVEAAWLARLEAFVGPSCLAYLRQQHNSEFSP